MADVKTSNAVTVLLTFTLGPETIDDNSSLKNMQPL
jgi:hypothetical protein